MIRVRDSKNVIAGLLFVGLAAVLGSDALSLPIGTAGRMGPGYVPLMLAIILGCLGLAVTASGLRVDGVAIGRFEWRGLGLVLAGIVAFGLTIERFGFIPAVTACVAICALASGRFRLPSAVGLIAFLAVFCWFVFVWGLGLPVRPFG